MPKLHISFLFLLIAMFIGLLLRMQFVFPTVVLNFKHFLHGHTHVTLLGWGINAVFIGIMQQYSTSNSPQKRHYEILFWLMQATIFGALISFPIQGYKAVSIGFSSLFLFMTYWFYALFLKTSKRDDSIGGRLLRWALFYLTLSSIGPWSLGVIMANDLRDSFWYSSSIYFYLHFLYNGFIIIGIIALVFKAMDKQKITYDKHKSLRFFWRMNLSIVPSLALSLLWLETGLWINIIGGIGAVMQIVSFVYFAFLLKEVKKQLKETLSPFVKNLFVLAMICFGIKIVMQFLSSIQVLFDLVMVSKSFTIIGYIHLVMIGVITLFILAYFVHQQKFKLDDLLSKSGIIVFLIGFIVSEILLFGQGVLLMFELAVIPYYTLVLFLVSALMPVGLSLFYTRQLRK